MLHTQQNSTAGSDLLIFDIHTGESQAEGSSFDQVREQVTLVCCSETLADQPGGSEPAWDEVLYAQLTLSEHDSDEVIPGRLA